MLSADTAYTEFTNYCCRLLISSDALLAFVNTGNLASINPVLHDPPDSDLGYSAATNLEE